MNSLPPELFAVLFGGFVVLMIVIAIVRNQQEGMRREELAMFAMSAGLRLTAPEELGMANYQGGGGFLSGLIDSMATAYDGFLSRFQGFQPFGEGYDFQVSSLLVGTKNNIDWYLFDYQYTTGSGKDRTRHYYSVYAARVPFSFPQLSLKPENLLTRLGEHLGMRELKFEVNEFNQRYYVTCNQDKVAYDILCPQVIEYLMRQPVRYWQLMGMYILVVQPDEMQASNCYEIMQEITDFVGLLPNYVHQDLGFQPKWTSAFDGP